MRSNFAAAFRLSAFVSACRWLTTSLRSPCISTTLSFLGVLKGKAIEARLQRKSQKLLRSILGGVFSEQVAPFLPDFPRDLKASEARFIGKPVDFLIFKGMDDQHISEVVFVELKSGKSQLSNNERILPARYKRSASGGTSTAWITPSPTCPRPPTTTHRPIKPLTSYWAFSIRELH
jgi:Endonuclease related to archaeal Holliday junction resolvase